MPEAKPKKTHERRQRWWVVTQHHETTVIQADDVPSTDVDDGERKKSILGPFGSQEEAQERADAYYATTLKGRAEAAGVI